jgi:hypothetical protein
MGILRPYPYNDIVSQMTIKFKVYFHYFLPFIPEKAIIPPGASPEGLYTQKQFDCTFIYAHPKETIGSYFIQRAVLGETPNGR